MLLPGGTYEDIYIYICSMMFYIIVLRSECENENGEIILGFVFIGTC